MQTKILFMGILSAALVFPVAPIYAQRQGPPTAMQGGPHGPMPKPKNLKVLPKNISHHDLMKVMHGFAGSLGVKCNFCHAAGTQPHHLDFASDAKPEKRIARTMMRMNRTINAKYLAKVNVPDAKPEQKQVTCGTCHRGHAIPAVFVLPPEPKHGMMRPGGPPK